MVGHLFPGQLVLEDEAPYCRTEPPDVDPGEFLSQKRILEERPWPFRVEFHPELPETQWTAFLTGSSCGPRDSAPCRNMERYAYVRPTGSLRPCLSAEIGNVFDTSFRALWNAPGFRAFRRLVRAHGRLPACARCPD
jgi:MoaA/NifB/PqqE/SkfB family radical SAM enzyme